jgi:AcrR family transcriptional regulator
MSQNQTPLRGRPKKLDRNLILQSALMEYWTKGPSNVSINDICKLTGASKPGVYREFSNDDGLKKSALETYQTLAVQPLLDILYSDKPVSETIDAAISFITQDRKSMGIPNGCLLVMMTAQSEQLGSSTLEELNRIRANLFTAYFSWVKRAKLEGGSFRP